MAPTRDLPVPHPCWRPCRAAEQEPFLFCALRDCEVAPRGLGRACGLLSSSHTAFAQLSRTALASIATRAHDHDLLAPPPPTPACPPRPPSQELGPPPDAPYDFPAHWLGVQVPGVRPEHIAVSIGGCTQGHGSLSCGGSLPSGAAGRVCADGVNSLWHGGEHHWWSLACV